MRPLTLSFAALLLAGCHDLELPPIFPLSPGVVRATVLRAQPGRAELSPAAGATVRLLGTTQQATADLEGNVVLADLRVTRGQLIFELDVDGDGQPDRSRVLSLEAARAGFGKDVNLGQLVLGRNGTLVGRVLREDRAQLSSGHGGVVVFLPQLPQLTVSGDDGSYFLPGVPEGDLVLSFSATGYRAEASNVSVGAAEELRVATVSLVADPGSASLGQLAGLVQDLDGTPLVAVQVRASARGQERSAQTTADGRFVFPSLDTGVYALGLEKSGLKPLRVDGVLVASGLNEVGPYVMTAGSGSLGVLDGGAPPELDAGNSSGSDAGLDAGTSSGSDGGLDAGSSADAGLDAGPGADAGVPLPMAIVDAFQVAAAGSQVTLNGTASTGAQPLSYTWTQLTDAGVVLTDNATPTAHSPRFTAPSLGSVVDFNLVVTDRFGRASTNAAVARVGVGRVPQARFGPDAGTYLGGDRLRLVSTSFDDAGLLLVGYDWRQVPAVAGATLEVDGGAAFLTLPALMSGDPAVVVGVELAVTNSIGATSPVFRQSYSATYGSNANWTLVAALVGTTPILATGTNPPARINSTVTTSVQSPSISYAWSCPGLGSTLSPQAGGAVEFAVPIAEGLDRAVSCVVTATGAPPLTPSTLQAAVGFVLRDDLDPTVTSSRPSSGLTRSSAFGALVRISEPLSGFVFSPPGSTCTATAAESAGKGVLVFSEQFLVSSTCSAMTLILTDRATVPNQATIAVAPAFSVDYQWQGPLVSTADFADPRPAAVSAGQLPFDLQAVSPPMLPPLPYALVARESTDLVTFDTDVMTIPGCSPECPMTSSRLALPGLDPAVPPPLGERVGNAGQELFVALQRAQDAGMLDTLYARRSATGGWTALAAAGELHNAGTELRRMRLVNGGLVSDVFDPATSTFVFPEQVLVDAGTDVTGVFTSEARVYRTGEVSVFRSTGGIDSFRRNVANVTWEKMTHFEPTGALYGRTWPNTDSFGLNSFGLVVRSLPDHLMGFDGSGRPLNTLGPVTGGYDFVQRGLSSVVAVSQNGDLRLYRGRITAPTAVAGPPRAVPLAPGDNRIDLDPSCEAAWPRLAFIEDALVITWQERCSPSTRWKVVSRVLR